MTWFLGTSLGDFDLEDSEILGVERSDNRMTIQLSTARSISRDESGNIAYESIHNPTLLVQGVAKEEVIGEGVDKHFPLDRIEVVEHTERKLELSGYRNNKPWYVWTIEAESVSISWEGSA